MSPKVKTFTEIENAKWLLGNWQNKISGGLLLESWEKKNDSTLTGSSFVIQGKDTVFAEQIVLEQSGSDLFYKVAVSDQNDGNTIAFKKTSSDLNHLIFENRTHDFPQKITYSLLKKDSLVATISGLKNGKLAAETFIMKRQ